MQQLRTLVAEVLAAKLAVGSSNPNWTTSPPWMCPVRILNSLPLVVRGKPVATVYQNKDLLPKYHVNIVWNIKI